MTTNIERAIEIVEDEHDPNFGPIDAPSLIYALNDAGLLMPDLPEPHGLSGRLKFWDHQMHSVTIHPHFGLRLIAEGTDIELTPVEARLIADSLYAAANHAEQKQGNV